MTFIDAQALTFSNAGPPLCEPLTFTIKPGLTLVRGGDGRGKTTLLRVLAGAQQPLGGRLLRRAHSCFYEMAADPAHDGTVAREWLQNLAQRHAGWNDVAAMALVESFGLAEHLHKPMFMLSTGSRRKLGLVGAAASAAELVLLDTPFAALDKVSGRVLTELLVEATTSTRQAWVLADYELPSGMDAGNLAGLIDLGD